MKKLIYITVFTGCIFFTNNGNSQNYLNKTDDFGRISLNVFIPDQVENISDITKSLLEDKLNQIVTQNGLGGYKEYERFIITPNISVLTKDIAPTAPAMVALTLQVSFYIGDGIDGIKFSSITKSYKGVGTNETKAYISALKNIKTDDSAYQVFIDKGKNKIIEYYNSQCEFILSEAETLSNQNNPEEAIYKLNQVPKVCKECYSKAMALAVKVYTKAQNRDCGIKLNQAQTIWSSNPTPAGAREVAAIISQIDPETSCYEASKKLINSINSSMNQKIEGLRNIELKYLYYRENNKVELEKLRIQSLRDISIAYANNRPVVVYNIRGWY